MIISDICGLLVDVLNSPGSFNEAESSLLFANGFSADA